MKLDANVLRYLGRDEFRVLTAVEMGMRNHELVPAELVSSIAKLKRGGAFKCMGTLLRHKLLHHESKHYDGYRLTPLGYDFLALKVLVNRGVISGLGRQIGVGKESDVFEATDPEGAVLVLKFHRLGRTSFRAVKSKRDYLKGRTQYSWLYLSRLAAIKEYAFLKALNERGYPVPPAVECNRHVVVMGLADGFPLYQVRKMGPDHATRVVRESFELICRLARHGLIHGDFNEFNLLVNDDGDLTMIDFPQMVSVSHRNARMYFDRDVFSVAKFFERKLGFRVRNAPTFDEQLQAIAEAQAAAARGEGDADTDDIAKALRASGFSHEEQETLEHYVDQYGNDGVEYSDDDEDEDEDDDDGSGGDGDEANGQHAGSEREVDARGQHGGEADGVGTSAGGALAAGLTLLDLGYDQSVGVRGNAGPCGSDDAASSDGAVCDLSDTEEGGRGGAPEQERPRNGGGSREQGEGAGDDTSDDGDSDGQDEAAAAPELDAHERAAVQRRVHEQAVRQATANARRAAARNAGKKGAQKGRRGGKGAAAHDAQW